MAEEEKNQKNPATAAETQAPAASKLQRFKSWYGERKKWAIPLSVLLVILLLAVIPLIRYKLAGLVLKRDFSIRLVDSTSHTPISGVTVTADGKSAESDAAGKVKLHVKVGDQKFSISKKYYAPGDANLLVPILRQKQTPDIEMSATGRQVRVSVKNLISKAVLADARIDVAGTTAKTGQDGSTTIVLPAGKKEQTAKLSLAGYNDATVTVKVSDNTVQQNDFSLTPAGKIYFLSKLSGKVDVVKTNLDGTDRQTVLAGTGKEDDQNTVLLASRDWKYLALLSKRSGNEALYLIDTASDNLSTIDSGNANFNLVGWSGGSFVYYLTRQGVQLWQPHVQAIKSFSPQTKQLLTLDQTSGQGTASTDYLSESYGGVYLVGRNVIYDKSWNSGYMLDPSQLSQKEDSINSIGVGGANHQTLKTFTAGSVYLSSTPYEADQVYYQTYINGNGGTAYYAYKDGKVTSRDDIADEFASYTRNPQTYLQSPSGNNTFWVEQRDGKNTLFIGDENGDNGKQIATLSDYSAYGWYTDDYVLVSKSSSELYIMPVKGGDAIKITDYHKPAVTLFGYGGGYGGL